MGRVHRRQPACRAREKKQPQQIQLTGFSANPTAKEITAWLTVLASALGVPKNIVIAPAITESNLNPALEHENKSKGKVESTDYGLMQVNDSRIGESGTIGGSKLPLQKTSWTPANGRTTL